MPGHPLLGRIAAGSVTVLPLWCHRGMTPQELRQHAVAILITTGNGHEERRAAAETLAALADWDPELLGRAAIGDTGGGNKGRDLLLEAVEVAEDERGWSRKARIL